MLKSATTAAFAALLFSSTTAMASDPAVKCESGKLKVASKYAACLLKADAKAVSKGETADYAKCDSKFSDKWAKTELKAGPMVCPSEGDETAIQDFLDACDASVADALAGGSLLLDPVTCDGALDACDAASGACDTNLSTCGSELSTTNSDLGACNGTLSTCTNDLSNCQAAFCDNGIAEFGEICDGSDLHGANCATQAPSTPYGTLACNGTCDGFVTTGCTTRFDTSGPTILDHQTGLEWENKSTSCPAGQRFSGIYTSTIPSIGTFESTIDPSGTSFTSVLTDSVVGAVNSSGVVSGLLYSGTADFGPYGILAVDGEIDCGVVPATTTITSAGASGSGTATTGGYLWSSSGTAPDGDAFTDFLAGLNGAFGNPCYAGHCDWRLPTDSEFEAIIWPEAAFLPDAASPCWTSSTESGFPTLARYFHTGTNSVGAQVKTAGSSVRAVRTGS